MHGLVFNNTVSSLIELLTLLVITFEFQRKCMDCDSYVRSNYAAAFSNVQKLISGIYITGQQKKGFRLYFIGAQKTTSTL